MDAKHKVLHCIEEKHKEVTELCSKLVQIPSTTPAYGGNTTAIARFIKQYLEQRGVEVETNGFDSNTISLTSSLAGASSSPRLILYGHMDAVPVGEESRWSFPPFCGEVRGGRILGRGAMDMKGGLASAITTYLAIHESGIELEGTLTLTIAPDEEKWLPVEGGLGTQWWLLNTGRLRGDACIMAEPSGLGIIWVGEKGEYWIKVTADGKPAHATMPILGENAIDKMMKALEAIKTVSDERILPPPELTETIEGSKAMLAANMAERGFKGRAEDATRMLDHIVVNVGEIQGGTMTNVVPDKCVAKLTLVLPMGLDPGAVKRRVEDELKKSGLNGVTFERFSGEMAGTPTYTKPTEEIVQVVKENARQIMNSTPRTEIAIGPGDGNVYRRMGVQTVNYGPDGTGLHSYDESVRVEDLIPATKVYTGAAIDFLNGD
jgi:succinyl-diaminopimelate desuccinylase